MFNLFFTNVVMFHVVCPLLLRSSVLIICNIKLIHTYRMNRVAIKLLFVKKKKKKNGIDEKRKVKPS